MDEQGEVDGYPLRRSWVQLEADVVASGRRLRRRRRAARFLPLTALVVVATGVGIGLAQHSDGESVRTDATAALGGPPAEEELPDLAFARVYEGGAEGSAIFVIDADGSAVRQLTADPAWRDGAPVWSPDGEWIAFDSQRDNPLRGVRTIMDVYVMRPDGTDVRRVTTTEVGNGNGNHQPTWSPDGERLAIASEDAAGVARIVVIRPDGSDARAVTEGPGDLFPAWSPDGRWIAFQRGTEIWVVRPDATGARRLTSSDRPTRLSWVPDSSAVTFADGAQLISVAVDGTGAREVTSTEPGFEHSDAAWTAGGEVLAHSADPDGYHVVELGLEGTRVTRAGGPAPGAIVLTEPRISMRRQLTTPMSGESDVNATFAPSS